MKRVLWLVTCVVALSSCREWDLDDLADASVDAGLADAGANDAGAGGAGAPDAGADAGFDAGVMDAGICGGAWCVIDEYSGAFDVARGVWADSPTFAVVGGYGPRVHVWDGTGWAQNDPPIGGFYVSAVWGLSDATVFLGSDTGDTMILGEQTSIPGASASAVSMIRGLSDGGSIYAVGRNSIRKLESGAWVACSSPISSGVTLRAVAVVAADDVWVAGSAGTILHSTDGTTFTAVDAGASDELRTGIAFGADDVWFAGGTGVLWHWDGVTWTRSARTATGSIWSMWGSASNDLWLLTEVGALTHFDGAATYTSVPVPRNDASREYVGLFGAGTRHLFISNNPLDGGAGGALVLTR